MTSRDQEALRDILGVMDRALGFPIADFDALERTVLTGFGDYKPSAACGGPPATPPAP